MLRVGIVGLPNVGKSTLFNALLKKQQALAANYPFATIEPNTGIVEVPDKRLSALAAVVAGGNHDEILRQINDDVPVDIAKNSWPPLKPATIEFVDIAGLVAGASKGEGLGNQFLANIRETNLICHVLRAFVDSDVVITGAMNPMEDLQTVRMELALKDIETLEKQDKAIRQLRDATISTTRDKAIEMLSNSQMINTHDWNEKEWSWLKDLHLLTAKPEIFVINITEDADSLKNAEALKREYAQKLNVSEDDIVVVSAKIEAEIASLPEEDQAIFMDELGITQSGIERMAATAYHKLGLMSYLTAGEIEVKAWTIRQGDIAPKAAGVIHTDFEKKFIKAEVINWKEYVATGGWKAAREVGKVRTEGKEYVMQDGDVVDFKIGG